MEDDILLAPAAAMVYTGLKSSTFYRYIKLGKMIPDKEGTYGQPLFYQSTLQNLLDDRIVGITGEQSQGKSLYMERTGRPKEDEIHPTGATIHWSERYRRGNRTYVPITCTVCSEKHNKLDGHLMRGLNDGSFTGYCDKCYRYSKRRSQLKGEGRFIDQDGYVRRHRLTFTPDEWDVIKGMDRHRHGYVLEHRAVVALAIGRALEPNEIVHHKNGVKDDNDISNLMIVKNEEHGKFHSQILSRLGDLERMQATIEELESRILYLESVVKIHLQDAALGVKV